MSMRPFLLGLTGSVGMGKSTTAGFFREMGVPVWDADAAVHRLYAPGATGTEALRALHPQAVGPAGVDRSELRRWIRADAAALARIETVIHPLVVADREAFIEDAAQKGEPLVVLDIPLLFETGAETGLDAVLVVSASPEEQRRRVLARPGMTEADLEAILARQVPDTEKRRRADYVIETDGLDAARAQVQDLAQRLADRSAGALGKRGAEHARDRSGHRNDGS